MPIVVKRLYRTGSCLNCGRCCVGCEHYSDVLVSGSHCKIYDTRPPPCQNYPAHFIQLIDDTCGYQFFDQATNARLYAKQPGLPLPAGSPSSSWSDKDLLELVFYGYVPLYFYKYTTEYVNVSIIPLG